MTAVASRITDTSPLHMLADVCCGQSPRIKRTPMVRRPTKIQRPGRAPALAHRCPYCQVPFRTFVAFARHLLDVCPAWLERDTKAGTNQTVQACVDMSKLVTKNAWPVNTVGVPLAIESVHSKFFFRGRKYYNIFTASPKNNTAFTITDKAYNAFLHSNVVYLSPVCYYLPLFKAYIVERLGYAPILLTDVTRVRSRRNVSLPTVLA